jgi:sugar phosphate isomerase/epimerase
MSYVILPRSYRGIYPFKLATTSYIYPDHVLPNVKLLAPYFDEIELVVFESEAEEDLTGDEAIRSLIEISSRQGLGFNVHLPMDVFLGERREEVRSKGVQVIRKIVEKTRCLNPSVYVLHLDPKGKTDLGEWKATLHRSLTELSGWDIDPGRISVETLGYPFEWVEDIVRRFGFSICLDIGHILTHGFDLPHYLERYLPATSAIHLHGLRDGTDHLGIDHLPEDVLALILSRLRQYKGVVSIEVFSIEDLKRSVKILEEQWTR